MTHTIVEGTSEPQDFQLQNEGANLIGTGLDVDIEAREDITGVTVAWLNQAAGTVRVTGVDNLVRDATNQGRYHVRYTLTDSGGKVGYVPNLQADSDLWLVVRV